jgi:hypothetical protein
MAENSSTWSGPPIFRAQPLRHDTLAVELACVGEDDIAGLVDVLAELQACAGTAQQACEFGFLDFESCGAAFLASALRAA